MIANIFALFSVLAFVSVMADVLLDEKQKANIAISVVRLWNWLDDRNDAFHRHGPIWLYSPFAAIPLGFLGASGGYVLVYYFLRWYDPILFSSFSHVPIMITVVPNAVISSIMIITFGRFGDFIVYIMWICLGAIAVILTVGSWTGLISVSLSDAFKVTAIAMPVMQTIQILFVTAFVLLLGIVSAFSVGFLKAALLFADRISAYQKGPIIALAAVLGAIAALLKTFS